MDHHAYRHHVAHPAVIFVEVPAAGSPEPFRTVKPGKYPVQHREAWRPATRPPSRQSKDKRLIEFMRDLDRRAEDARQFMAEARRQTA
jgi:hypothetical protein